MGEPKSDSIADNVAQVSISDIDEEVTRQAPPHKKIYVIFFGLFLILIFGFTEKIYQMRIASEHLELTHNKKLLTISKEHENVRARLQKEIDELSQENIFLKRAKPKPIIKSKIDSTDLSNNNCQCVSKLNSNDFSIFEEDAADEGYNLNFKSCWGDLGFSYKTGQCTSHLKDVVSQSYSSTKHSINKFVHGSTTDEVTIAKKRKFSEDGPFAFNCVFGW